MDDRILEDRVDTGFELGFSVLLDVGRFGWFDGLFLYQTIPTS